MITIPTQTDGVPVMSVFGWIMFHQHLDVSDGWDLPWADYKAGFGSIDGNFWLGLEKVHLLTSSQPYRLRVELQDRSTNLWYSAEYWSFKIGDELNDKYRLELAGYSGDVANSLMDNGDWNGNGCFGCYNHNGIRFSTKDNDNDLSTDDSYNCAIKRRGGWWYNNCFFVCLTCKWSDNYWRYLGYVGVSRMLIIPQ